MPLACNLGNVRPESDGRWVDPCAAGPLAVNPGEERSLTVAHGHVASQVRPMTGPGGPDSQADSAGSTPVTRSTSEGPAQRLRAGINRANAYHQAAHGRIAAEVLNAADRRGARPSCKGCSTSLAK
jgi:hypothetical protein